MAHTPVAKRINEVHLDKVQWDRVYDPATKTTTYTALVAGATVTFEKVLGGDQPHTGIPAGGKFTVRDGYVDLWELS